MKSLKEQHAKRLLGHQRTNSRTSTWLQCTAVSWREGPNTLVSPCKTLPPLSNSWPTMLFLHKMTMFMWEHTRHSSTAVTSGRQENTQWGPQTASKAWDCKASSQVFHEAPETSDRALRRSQPPPKQKRVLIAYVPGLQDHQPLPEVLSP
jgi:hypothetical protein